MSTQPAADKLQEEIEAVMEPYAENMLLTQAEAVGVLETIKYNILAGKYGEGEEDESGED